jgi:two-component system sensor histidine kinase KdpD
MWSHRSEKHCAIDERPIFPFPGKKQWFAEHFSMVKVKAIEMSELIMKSTEIEHFSFISHTKQHKRKLIVINSAVTIGIMTLVTFLAFLFRDIGFYESNIIVAYILGVLLVAKQTEGFFYGIAASIIGVLTFNFFFTEPYYSFSTYRPDYSVTFIIMLIAAIITSTLTTKVKKEAALSHLREERAKILYQFSKNLLQVRSIYQIAEVGVKDIAELFNRSVIIAAVNSSGGLREQHIYVISEDDRATITKSFNEIQVITELVKKSHPQDTGTITFDDSSVNYLPIKGPSGHLGVIGVCCVDNKPLSDEQKILLEAVTTQIALAIEREILSEKQQKSVMEMESERLRGNLLRAVSHDLRTPLTGILGATATILDNDDALDKTVKRNLLQGVYEDASWLIHSVENILSITRMDEGKIEIKKNMEAVEEVVAEAVARIKKLTSNHTLQIDIPDDLVILPMDGILIEQVLINLIDNAIKYTPFGTIIEIKVQIDGEKVVFDVSDNGNGIAEEKLNLIFNRFYTTSTMNNVGRHGTGLGLAICKSIITAHDGEITAFNNASGGATFRFVLPCKE